MANTKNTTLETEILREETRKAVRKANQRLSYMQKTGHETNAVKNALHQIELTRKDAKTTTFKVNKKNAASLTEQAPTFKHASDVMLEMIEKKII